MDWKRCLNQAEFLNRKVWLQAEISFEPSGSNCKHFLDGRFSSYTEATGPGARPTPNKVPLQKHRHETRIELETVTATLVTPQKGLCDPEPPVRMETCYTSRFAGTDHLFCLELVVQAVAHLWRRWSVTETPHKTRSTKYHKGYKAEGVP